MFKSQVVIPVHFEPCMLVRPALWIPVIIAIGKAKYGVEYGRDTDYKEIKRTENLTVHRVSIKLVCYDLIAPRAAVGYICERPEADATRHLWCSEADIKVSVTYDCEPAHEREHHDSNEELW